METMLDGMPGPQGKEDQAMVWEACRIERLGWVLGVPRIKRRDNGIGVTKGNGKEVIQGAITMSLPAGMEAFIAEQREVGSSGPRVDGQDLSQGPRPGRILRRAGPVLNGTSVFGSGAMSDPGILGGWADMVVMGVPRVAGLAAEVTEAAAPGLEEILAMLEGVKRRIPRS